MTLGEIVRILGSGEEDTETELNTVEPIGYSIDSRRIRRGELFFAIRGENHDGHQFVGDALAGGALAAVVSREWNAVAALAERKLIRVGDTLSALQLLAASVVKSWRGRLIAITGSMGKTTTKDLTAALLAPGGRVIKTVGNLNNAYGLPLSILKMESGGSRASEVEFGVFEMGMNHRGELAALASIAPPDLAVVTNVAPVHLEYFSSVDEIAAAKSELVRGVKPGGAAVLNVDDERVARMKGLRNDLEVRTFGIERNADVMALALKAEGVAVTRFQLVTPRGSVDAKLQLGGRHNVYNALASAAVADLCDIPLDQIADALASFSVPKMRGEVHEFKEGFTVIDDSYNSNPQALVEMIAHISGATGYQRKIVVAGEMLELGAAGPRLHREAGRSVASQGVDLLIGVRGLARELVESARQSGLTAECALYCETPEEAAEVLKREARPGDLILVKGSRGVKTDIVVERMKQWSESKGKERERE
ncbi:MAG TPA: UDP-N-acetylmuramoyl-tripeptide--D-alanyl-D-alanine ligase [Blastocatellia bacterium]|nr:UDP-N-acetylmuramoyl-tripeptide--D-alanyl-D-alanine ligase [Blastocatellia bacterium]